MTHQPISPYHIHLILLSTLPTCCIHITLNSYAFFLSNSEFLKEEEVVSASRSFEGSLGKFKMRVLLFGLSDGELEEEVYMEQPEGFVIQGQENKFCKLIKSLYGLKQALKQWHQKFDQVILSNGFRINESDKCVYSRFVNGKVVIIYINVDDMLIFGTDLEQVQMTKKLLPINFDMKDLGEADVILGIKILQNQNRLMLTQSHYIEKILKRFDSFNCLPVSTSFEVGILSRHTSSPGKEHWDVVNQVFKYLKKTIDYGLEFEDPSVLEGYTDESWITDQEDYTSTSEWIFTVAGGAVSWGSKKRSCLTGSTMAAEFVALALCCKEG
nr:zinc finger, CCHC-type [Tanacetum cinerariifolium]